MVTSASPRRQDLLHRRPGDPRIIRVADDVFCLQLSIVNVYFVGQPGSEEWVLVDAGLFTSAEAIRKAAAELFGAASSPKAILLTHGHFDHVGALDELTECWDVPIYAHRMETPYLTGRSDYPPPDPTVGGGLMARMAPLYPKCGADFGDRVQTLPADGTVPPLPEWKAIETPGHSPGHVSFFRERDRVLIAGDAFVTTKQESALAVLTQRLELHGPPAYFTPDWEAAGSSVRKLAELRPRVVGTGHGKPVEGEEFLARLDELATHFEQLAVPRQGRYVGRPARMDENGVVSVPPPVSDSFPLLAGVGAVAALAIALRLRDR
jgi:glyoxylase-like metal-dependent hydrolase (beta-lactamase superfamily II)